MSKRSQLTCVLFLIGIFLGSARAASLRVFEDPDSASRVIDKIPSDKKHEVLEETDDGEWAKIFYKDRSKKKKSGWIQQKKISFSDSDSASESSARSWSFGFGIGAFSSEGASQILLSGDLRYLWTRYTESLLGVDLSLGTESSLGYRLGQKFFAPLTRRVFPYVYLGFRQSDVSSFQSSAYEPGVGLQYNSSSSGYFEISLNYLIRKPFNAAKANIIYMNASSGFRF